MKSRLWLVFILITVCTWGVWGAFSGYQIQHGVPDTIVYIAWALSMIPCAIVAWIVRCRKQPTSSPSRGGLVGSRSILLGCVVGLLGAGGQLVLFKALTLGPSYIIYPFISMSPVIVITLAAIFLKERASKWQVAGIAVALAAILLLSLETNAENSPVSGWLWIVLAILVLLAWGVQGFFMKFANNEMDAESIFVWMTLTGLVLIPVAYFMGDDAARFFAENGMGKVFWSSFGIQILNSIGALTLVYAYRYGKAVVVSPMEGLSPMVTVLLSLIILSVIPNPLQIAGLVCAAFAMYALSK